MTTILLQNATEIYYKMHQVFSLQNATVLLQNATVITLKVIKVSKLNVKRFSHTVRETKPLVVL